MSYLNVALVTRYLKISKETKFWDYQLQLLCSSCRLCYAVAFWMDSWLHFFWRGTTDNIFAGSVTNLCCITLKEVSISIYHVDCIDNSKYVFSYLVFNLNFSFILDFQNWFSWLRIEGFNFVFLRDWGRSLFSLLLVFCSPPLLPIAYIFLCVWHQNLSIMPWASFKDQSGNTSIIC